MVAKHNPALRALTEQQAAQAGGSPVHGTVLAKRRSSFRVLVGHRDPKEMDADGTVTGPVHLAWNRNIALPESVNIEDCEPEEGKNS